jgi:hypothetical protein
MEALFAAAGVLLAERQDAVYRSVPADLPLDRRLDEFCAQRARMLEILAPAARAARIREPFSPQLRRNKSIAIAKVRTEIEDVFGRELEAAGEGRERVLTALTVATTFASWSMLRDEVGLTADEACAVMRRTVAALLVSAVAAGLS